MQHLLLWREIWRPGGILQVICGIWGMPTTPQEAREKLQVGAIQPEACMDGWHGRKRLASWLQVHCRALTWHLHVADV